MLSPGDFAGLKTEDDVLSNKEFDCRVYPAVAQTADIDPDLMGAIKEGKPLITTVTFHSADLAARAAVDFGGHLIFCTMVRFPKLNPADIPTLEKEYSAKRFDAPVYGALAMR